MRPARPIVSISSGTAILALLAGCSGAGSSTPTTPDSPVNAQSQATMRATAFQAQPFSPSVVLPGVGRLRAPDLSIGFADPDAAAKAAVIVSDDVAGTVNAYTQSGKLTAKITGLFAPQGVAADTAGNIYITNTTSSNILIYKNDYKTHLLTLNDPNEYPTGVDVDDAASLVGVTNITTTYALAGSVSFYSTTKSKLGGDYRYIRQPCVTVANKTWAKVYFGAFDKSSNFYIDGTDPNGKVLVGVVTGGCKATAITTLTTGNTLGFPGGVQVSASGKIAIDDQQAATVFTYNPVLTGSLGKPIASTLLTGAKDPVTFAFTKNGKLLWAADAANADAFDETFPAGNVGPQNPITGFSQPIGVVVTPVETP